LNIDRELSRLPWLEMIALGLFQPVAMDVVRDGRNGQDSYRLGHLDPPKGPRNRRPTLIEMRTSPFRFPPPAARRWRSRARPRPAKCCAASASPRSYAGRAPKSKC